MEISFQSHEKRGQSAALKRGGELGWRRSSSVSHTDESDKRIHPGGPPSRSLRNFPHTHRQLLAGRSPLCSLYTISPSEDQPR